MTVSNHDSVISTKDLGEELAKISLDLAKRDNASYAELRLVNTRSEAVSVVNENPASEEASTIGVGIRVLYKDLGWGFADTDELEHDSIRETTKKALALARGASKLGIKVTRASEPVYVDKWAAPVKKDPFRVPIETKYELLQDTTKRMKENDVVARRGQMTFDFIYRCRKGAYGGPEAISSTEHWRRLRARGRDGPSWAGLGDYKRRPSAHSRPDHQ